MLENFTRIQHHPKRKSRKKKFQTKTILKNLHYSSLATSFPTILISLATDYKVHPPPLLPPFHPPVCVNIVGALMCVGFAPPYEYVYTDVAQDLCSQGAPPSFIPASLLPRCSLCPSSMPLSSPLCTRFDVTSSILLNIYIYIYTNMYTCNDDPRVFIQQQVHRCQYPRGTATLICNSRPPQSADRPMDGRMKHQRSVIGG